MWHKIWFLLGGKCVSSPCSFVFFTLDCLSLSLSTTHNTTSGLFFSGLLVLSDPWLKLLFLLSRGFHQLSASFLPSDFPFWSDTENRPGSFCCISFSPIRPCHGRAGLIPPRLSSSSFIKRQKDSTAPRVLLLPSREGEDGTRSQDDFPFLFI